MAILPIVKYPEPILKKTARTVAEVNKQIRKFIDNMAETMYEAPGVGLAAPQVNQPLRIIVVDPTGEKAQQLTALVNPEIIAAEGEISSEEGCLSIPGITCQLKRFAKVRIRGYEPIKGKWVEIEAEEILARIFQHEIDHLNGTLILDRLGPVKRALYKRRYLKNLKELRK